MIVNVYKFDTDKIKAGYIFKNVYQVVGHTVVFKDGSVKRFDRNTSMVVVKESVYAK